MTSSPATSNMRESALQRIDRKTSSRSMLLGIILFSFMAGMRIDNGISRYWLEKAEYRWLVDFALDFGFLVVAIRWAVPLLKRATVNRTDSIFR
jgi:hypothetical protein